jgi:hypothetical protein
LLINNISLGRLEIILSLLKGRTVVNFLIFFIKLLLLKQSPFLFLLHFGEVLMSILISNVIRVQYFAAKVLGLEELLEDDQGVIRCLKSSGRGCCRLAVNFGLEDACFQVTHLLFVEGVAALDDVEACMSHVDDHISFDVNEIVLSKDLILNVHTSLKRPALALSPLAAF